MILCLSVHGTRSVNSVMQGIVIVHCALIAMKQTTQYEVRSIVLTFSLRKGKQQISAAAFMDIRLHIRIKVIRLLRVQVI